MRRCDAGPPPFAAHVASCRFGRLPGCSLLESLHAVESQGDRPGAALFLLRFDEHPFVVDVDKRAGKPGSPGRGAGLGEYEPHTVPLRASSSERISPVRLCWSPRNFRRSFLVTMTDMM